MQAIYVNSKIDDETPAADMLLAFFHGQRTGGSALRHILAEAVGPDAVFATQYAGDFEHWQHMTPEKLENIRVFAGHSNYSEIDLGRELRFISLMRHPVYRVISIYYYVKRYKTHALHHFTENATIDEFYYPARDKHPSYFNNVQCKRISGKYNYAAAQKAVESHMWAIGATERLSDFTDWLLPKLGAPKQDVPDLGWDKDKYIKELENAKLVEDILKDNAEDLKLFSYMNENYFGMPAEYYPGL
jgi:hypothetical protein